MPSSIPYNHPSLVLGNTVDTRVLDLLSKINALQANTDAAQDKLNSFIMMKRSITMTINELADIGLGEDDETKGQLSELDNQIKQSAGAYLSARLNNETQIQQLRLQLNQLEIQESLESPLDFGVSVLTSLPLSSESLKLDSQYFSFGSNLEDDTLANVEKFIRSNTSQLGAKSGEITGAVSSQISSQIQNHNIAGTLIIMASCTHSNVRLFQPLVIDPDKAVATWNQLYASNSKINIEQLKDPTTQNTINGSQSDAEMLSIVSGASYGSSFVGMVHILNSDSNSQGDLDKLKGKLDEKLKIGGWLENSSGGFGIDESTMNEVKAFLSTQTVASHVSIVTMGAIPSMKSSALDLGIKKLTETDPGMLASLLTETFDTVETVNSEAEKSKTNARILSAQNSKTQGLVKGLAKIDHQNNKILDINSMMNAFESYVEAVQDQSGNTGVPINFFLKKISKPEIEKLWLKKYYSSSLNDNKPEDNKSKT